MKMKKHSTWAAAFLGVVLAAPLMASPISLTGLTTDGELTKSNTNLDGDTATSAQLDDVTLRDSSLTTLFVGRSGNNVVAQSVFVFDLSSITLQPGEFISNVNFTVNVQGLPANDPVPFDIELDGLSNYSGSNVSKEMWYSDSGQDTTNSTRLVDIAFDGDNQGSTGQVDFSNAGISNYISSQITAGENAFFRFTPSNLNTNQGRWTLHSADATDSALRPGLEITVIPEPGTFLLMGMPIALFAASTALRRARRGR